MSFLKRWKASPTNLSGPDFDKAEWLEIDLAGTKVRFKNPPLTKMIPYIPPVTRLDIYGAHALEAPTHKEELSMSKALYQNGWNFYPGMFNENAIGGLVVDLVLIKITSFDSANESVFNKDTFVSWVMQQEKSIYDLFNESKRKDYEENGLDNSRMRFFKYPIDKSEISQQEFNGHLWLRYSLFEPGGSETIVYRTAIADDFLLSITLEPNCYRDDYESPAHNLQEVVSQAIESFMQSMHISLSPESQKQYNKANPKLLAENI